MKRSDQRGETVFVLRIWREPGEAAVSTWRASAVDAKSGERVHFTDYESLIAFIDRRRP